MYKAQATHDAWRIGTHTLPEEARQYAEEQIDRYGEYKNLSPLLGFVVVRERRRGTWELLSPEEFDLAYEWVFGQQEVY
jgi:hypothetical protein